MKDILLFLSLLVLTQSGKLPTNFKKCNRKQPDFSTCVLEAAIHGITQLTRPYPEVNLPEIDPFFLPEASITGGEGQVAVNQKFRDIKLYGFSKVKLEKFEFDFDNKKILFVGTFPEVKIDCEYEVKGQVLLFPVNGKGASVIVLKNLKVETHFYYEEIKKRSKTYFKIKSSDITLDPERVVFDFKNLVDASLSSSINQVLNDNWKVVFDDVKGGYIEIINQILSSLFNNFFSKVPVDEAFDS